MAETSNAGRSFDRPRDLGFERRMSDQEALMWNIEKDPWLNPSGAALSILDRPVDMDYMLAKVRFGLSRVPRLRERAPSGNVVDLRERHARPADVAGGGSSAQLAPSYSRSSASYVAFLLIPW